MRGELTERYEEENDAVDSLQVHNTHWIQSAEKDQCTPARMIKYLYMSSTCQLSIHVMYI